MWWKEGYTYNQQVGENIVDAVLVAGTRTALEKNGVKPRRLTEYGMT